MNVDARVHKLMVLPQGVKIRSVSMEQVEVTQEGFVGDRHAGLTREAGSRDSEVPRGTVIRNTRQISIVAQKDLTAIAERLAVPEVEAEWLGANICLSGINDLTKINHGTRLLFEGGVVLVVEAENKPCRTPGEVLAQEYPDSADIAGRFAKEALGLRGLVAWVDRGGSIKVGEGLSVKAAPEGAEG